VRIWGRGAELDCRSVLKFDDWVYSVAARGGALLVSAGACVRAAGSGPGLGGLAAGQLGGWMPRRSRAPCCCPSSPCVRAGWNSLKALPSAPGPLCKGPPFSRAGGAGGGGGG
jgi:hypothetical protein